jgi:release factor glutamine methyltransferase
MVDQMKRSDNWHDLKDEMPWEFKNGPFSRFLISTMHFLAYHFVLRRRTNLPTRAAGMRLIVRDTVFHPSWFISSERFVDFIDTLDLKGKWVIDVGTGTGILAIAAARAGAKTVIATDINPNAALSVPENAHINGVADRVTAVCMDLLSGFVASPLVDLILANLPKHAQEPRDVADRGWHGGSSHRYILPLFDQAYDRLKPNGQLYVMLSSHSDLDLIEKRLEQAGFSIRIAKRYSIFIDSFILYECTRSVRNRQSE